MTLGEFLSRFAAQGDSPATIEHRQDTMRAPRPRYMPTSGPASLADGPPSYRTRGQVQAAPLRILRQAPTSLAPPSPTEFFQAAAPPAGFAPAGVSINPATGRPLFPPADAPAGPQAPLDTRLGELGRQLVAIIEDENRSAKLADASAEIGGIPRPGNPLIGQAMQPTTPQQSGRGMFGPKQQVLQTPKDLAAQQQMQNWNTSQPTQRTDPATGWPLDPVTGQPVAPLQYGMQLSAEEQRRLDEQRQRQQGTQWAPAGNGIRLTRRWP